MRTLRDIAKDHSEYSPLRHNCTDTYDHVANAFYKLGITKLQQDYGKHRRVIYNKGTYKITHNSFHAIKERSSYENECNTLYTFCDRHLECINLYEIYMNDESNYFDIKDIAFICEKIEEE